ncbi:MAG: DUF5115 domain-containing protein, partial [Prevotella sp.]|nr:DUF5115 domain-containing protein [Prevotella sp.]
MKKLLIMASAALLFASCGSDTYEEWAQPQTYGADSATTVKFAATAAPEIDFEKVTTDSVVLFTPTLTSENAVKAQTLTVTLFNDKKTANYVLNADAKGQVKASELQAAV